MWKFFVCSLLVAATVHAQSNIDGKKKVWQPITLTLTGPEAAIDQNSPNPFLDYRLQVRFKGPANQIYDVPGYFDADGAAGKSGRLWRVHFSPDQAGVWTYEAALRSGQSVAIQLEPDAGQPVELPSSRGQIEIGPVDSDAPGFLKWGRLEYVGKHYLKFRNGPYWIRGGTDEPEDFLGYAGFVRTSNKHKYAAHVEDWRPGDPDWNDGQGKAIIGALNSLASQHVNSIYFLTMNIGGDGKNVWPWYGNINPKGDAANENLHFDVEKLRQWEIVLNHAERLGIFLHVVFNEAEIENKKELDDGELGPERKLYYREMIARYSHHLAMQWNLCEEYNLNFDLGPERMRQFADYVHAVDPYHHPITLHTAGDPVEKMRMVYGDPRFEMTSIQLNQRPIHEVTEAVRMETIKAGRPLPVSLDEFTLDRGQRASHIPVDDAEGHRIEKIWPTYLSGGNIEFILGDLLKTDNFKTPERVKLWQYLWYARKFMEAELPFWDMEPADQLVEGAGTIPMGIGKNKTIPYGPQVFVKPGEVCAVYYPKAEQTGSLKLDQFTGPLTKRWYNPRTGQFAGDTTTFMAEPVHQVGAPPSDAGTDWVLLIKKPNPEVSQKIDTSGFRDSGGHWRKIRDENRFIHVEPKQQFLSDEQVPQIVNNILLFQRANGGWPKDYDMMAILTPEQAKIVRDTHQRTDTSYDNHNIHSQVDYLAKAYTQSHEESWKEACLRGFDFILKSQYPNGGFPQRYPDRKNYSSHITFNDGVMIGIMSLLQDAVDQTPQWKWLDQGRRDAAQKAIENGIGCILKCQIVVNGVRTGWCQQHDETTYAAAPARTFELASICPQDTTEICRFFMRQPHPSAEVVAAMDDAVKWMEEVQLKGIRIERIASDKVDFQRHSADFDVIVKDDPTARPIWARHYEIGTNRPIFAGRDAVKRYSFAEIERERRTGTLWYGYWPDRLLDKDYPSWKKTIAHKTVQR